VDDALTEMNEQWPSFSVSMQFFSKDQRSEISDWSSTRKTAIRAVLPEQTSHIFTLRSSMGSAWQCGLPWICSFDLLA